MRQLLALLLFVLVSGPSFAQGTRVDAVEIVNRGIYLLEAGKVSASPNTPTGTITTPETFKLVEATTTVQAKLGLEFGFEYRVVGAPAGAEVTVEIVNTYPAPGLKSPGDARPIPATKYERVKKVGEVVYAGYGFEHDWEMVPGTWSFEIWQGGKKLAEQSFTVTK